ncbi:MAG: GNAT family N-acetyltransferase [Cyanobacteriota bacterium]
MTNKKTNFYKHHKNKPYRYIGIARHSETLEELVLYETLYENDLGKLWVRPKEMFFEKVDVNGKQIERFRPIEFKIEIYKKLTEDKKSLIMELAKNTLGYFDLKKFESKLENHKNFLFLFAYDEKKPVGFKIGYAQDDSVFYSWMGGVEEKYRVLGIASKLMGLQHDYCKEKGFKLIETRTLNKFSGMLSLNLKNGFEIVGTFLDYKNQVKIIMQKKL